MYQNNTFWVIDIVGFLRIMVRTLSHMGIVGRKCLLYSLPSTLSNTPKCNIDYTFLDWMLALGC